MILRMNNINIEYFSPIFKRYLLEIQPVKDCGYWQLPFIPYTFHRYKSAPFKVFYIGRDTYYWCEYDNLYEMANPEKYIKDNASYVNVENIKKDWSKPGSFWGTVGKLHLQLITGVYHPSIKKLTQKDWDLLEEIGYGNLFSIERIDTLKKKKYTIEGSSCEKTEYDDIKNHRHEYKFLCNLAKPFEGLKTIFSAYGEPDIVFILSWTDNENFFEGLDYECEKEWYEHNFRSMYISKTHKTKVIWSSHPNRFHFLGTNQKEMCQYLCDTVNELLDRQ